MQHDVCLLRVSNRSQVWLNTGGVQGESPLCQTPALMETAGIPYIGHTPLNAAMLDDKALFKMACSGLGLPTAPFVVHNPAAGRLRPSKCAAFKAAFGSYRGPFIVKPVNGECTHLGQQLHPCPGSARDGFSTWQVGLQTEEGVQGQGQLWMTCFNAQIAKQALT